MRFFGFSLNQGQGSVFTVWGFAQSTPRLEKPKNRRFSHKNPNMFDFRFNTPIPSLNQGRGSVFKVRECAQSIPRLEKPKNRRLSHKNSKMFDFRFNISIHFLNQGQESVFKVQECAQSIPRIKLPLRSHLLKNFLTFLLRHFFLLSAPPPGVVAPKLVLNRTRKSTIPGHRCSFKSCLG